MHNFKSATKNRGENPRDSDITGFVFWGVWFFIFIALNQTTSVIVISNDHLVIHCVLGTLPTLLPLSALSRCGLSLGHSLARASGVSLSLPTSASASPGIRPVTIRGGQ